MSPVDFVEKNDDGCDLGDKRVEKVESAFEVIEEEIEGVLNNGGDTLSQ